METKHTRKNANACFRCSFNASTLLLFMDDDAIEEFWIRKVERHRKERDEAFKQLEREALEEEEAAEAGKDKDEL